MDDKVSIITPCYNGAKYISQTIESVLSQTYTNWEMIIINDGSKDNSVEVIEPYTQKDNRIKLVNQKNGGSANARNNGIRLAIGRYIALLDADDLWENNFLEEQLRFMKEKNALLVFSSYKRIDDQSREILRPVTCKKKVTYNQMLITDFIGCLTGLYDTSVFGKVYLREELKSLRDDYAYWLDIIKFTQVAYGNQKFLAKYRVLDTAVTANKQKLIKVQYKFYRDFLRLGVVRSLYNTIYWGLRGVYVHILPRIFK